MSALKPYPHYEINVKDNSIYRFSIDETLPVHRPLWVLHTQEGPVGKPVWCPTASYLKKKFGEETLNLANKKFASPQAFFLNQTMSYNGAFIVRALPDDATYATAILFAKVQNAEIVQYKIDNDPISATYGERFVDSDPDSESYGKYIPRKDSEDKVDTEEGIKITYFVRPATKSEIEKGLDDLKVEKDGVNTLYPILAFKALYPGEYGNDLAFRFFYKSSENSAPNSALYKTIFNCMSVARREYNSSTTNLIFDIYGRTYNTFAADPECTDPETGVQMDMDNVITNAFDIDSADGTDFPFTVYTYEENIKAIGDAIIAIEKIYNNGRSLAFEEFGYSSADNMNGYQINILSGENIKGTPYDHVAISGRVDVDPEIVYSYNETGDTEFVEGKTYYKSSSIPGVGGAKRYTKLVLNEDYEVGDAIVADDELAEQVISYEPAQGTYAEGKEYATRSEEEYIALTEFTVGNPIPEGVYEKVITTVPHYNVFERSESDNSSSFDEQTERVILDPNIDIFLTGGSDGSLHADDPKTFEAVRDDFVDHFFYNFLKLRINPKIVDKFRYPFTHLYDPGYSMTTKYAMLDFLDTRDDVAVELATQVLFPNNWVTGFPITEETLSKIKLNDQAKDVQDGMVLRERALLMRESVLKGTDCMRASIFPQAGKPVAATYTKPVPFTFWSAIKHAMYGNTDQMSAQEPRGLPYSYNELFKTWNWTNYSELLKEKTWNAGLNYCQYADMKRIFYPALRTVYREESSVLVDQWVVDALVYTKHECRKAWARFSGRNDKQATLEKAIKVYLEDTLAYLYNGKYDFEISVYKTEEEQKIGYIEHVKLRLTFPATMRVINFDIEVNREGYTPESEG